MQAFFWNKNNKSFCVQKQVTEIIKCIVYTTNLRWLMILYQSRDLDLDTRFIVFVPNVSTCYLIISELLAHAKQTIMIIEYWRVYSTIYAGRNWVTGTVDPDISLRGLIIKYEVFVGSTAGSHRYSNSIYYCSLFFIIKIYMW